MGVKCMGQAQDKKNDIEYEKMIIEGRILKKSIFRARPHLFQSPDVHVLLPILLVLLVLSTAHERK